ncbi:sialin-like isoform X2 [Penaeus chinensis]|uniref:sialin-like isoform X2 n=1 Tax=Penaeus chinensis TaxID=139456 RepID=UPI001FB680B3|nr:sialin-like isoform X2 [Penaeus chinensis]
MAGNLNISRLPTRMALAAMAWLGFINLYMVRINLSVIIVAMVRRNSTVDRRAPCLSPFNNTLGLETDDNPRMTENEEGEMNWDETIQGFVLGSFFYGYAVSQIIGGRVSELYGTKWVFGGCIFSGGLSALLSPVAARAHYGVFIALRIIQGICQGMSWPSMHACIARWIPPLERPRFIAFVYFAAALSTSFTMPLCGAVIATHGWAAAFYVTGALSLVWCVLWFGFMHDSPREHPRITSKELKYIEDALQEQGRNTDCSLKLPVRSIVTSLPVWAIIFANAGNTWGLAVFIAQLPTYMKNILGFSIKQNGFLSALPFLLRYVGAILWSSLGDWLTTHRYLSIRASRRLFSILALWGPATMVLGVSFAGCNWQATIGLICLAFFCNGAVTASIMVNHTDIAPNFSGTLLGIDNTFSSIVSFVVPVVVGVMTDGEQTLGQWQKVFWICVPMYAFTEVFYLAFSSGSVQPWNYRDETSADQELSAKNGEHSELIMLSDEQNVKK